MASSAGTRPRRLTSLTSMTSRIASRRRRDGAHRHVVDDHGDLGFAIDAPGFVGDADRLARSEEGIRAALIHQRVGPEARRHLGAARLADELDVIDVGRAVDPLVGARQRRHRFALMEALDAARCRARRRGREPRARAPPRAQRSRAACSVGAIVPAAAQRVRSRETTTRRPSRVPLRSVASFMRLSFGRLRRGADGASPVPASASCRHRASTRALGGVAHLAARRGRRA